MEKKIKIELTEQEFRCLSGIVLQPMIYGAISYKENARLSLMKKVFNELKGVRLDKEVEFNEYYDSYYKDKINGD